MQTPLFAVLNIEPPGHHIKMNEFEFQREIDNRLMATEDLVART